MIKFTSSLIIRKIFVILSDKNKTPDSLYYTMSSKRQKIHFIKTGKERA